MVIKTVLISPSFTKSAAGLISSHLNNYKTEQVSQWPKSSNADALIIRSKDHLNTAFLKRFEKAQIIVTATSGFDHIDLSLSNKVKLCYSPNANICSASEITLWHILNLLKKGTLLKSESKRSEQTLGKELNNKKASLIGLGRIGLSVAKKLQAFGCEVSAYDPYVETDVFEKASVKSVNFEDALRSADIVSLHCPLTSKTKKIISKDSLALMHKESILVNCARGPLVDEKSLLNVLKKERIHGACLDVFEEEPLSMSSELRKLKNVTLSPHVGGYTVEAQNKSALEAAQQVKNWFEQDQPVLNILPPTYKWAEDLED